MVPSETGSTTSKGGTVASLESTIRGYAEHVEKQRQELAQVESTIGRMEEVAEQPFARADDLERTRKQVAALEADMAANPAAPPAWLRNGTPVETGAVFTVPSRTQERNVE